MLSLAAFLTAFYTMRQISLTFLGEPRTPLAEHAHESNAYMVFPLIPLAFLAVTVGWFGIPDNFLGTEGVFNNVFHHFAGGTVYETLNVLYEENLIAHKIITLPWSWVPILLSITVALGGLLAGYLVYGRKPLKAGEPDPLIAPLGPIHAFLMNKWYVDELYMNVFVKPVTAFSENVVYNIIDKGFIDGFLHLVANIFLGLARIAKMIENAVFDDFVNGVKDRFLWLSREFRTIQTGKVQEYALISTLMAVALVVVIIASYVYQLF
jgi:NADH-quinone oxidoreductase subunit L